MEEFFANLGFNSWTFSYIILPIFIFISRILDVSINTVRIIFVMSGRKWVSSILGFFESIIWLLAIGQIFQNVDNIVSYIAYPLGFAFGIYVGMVIEEKLALGKVVVRIINNGGFNELIPYLNKKALRHTILRGESMEKPEFVLFCVIKRDELGRLIDEIKAQVPNSFYTVESVKKASEAGFLPEESRKRRIGSWMGSTKRK